MSLIPLVCLGFLFVSLYYVVTTDTFDPKPKSMDLSQTPLYTDATQPIDARVADLLSYMTLEEKIGQMTLIEKNSLEAQGDIATYYLGALLSGAGSKPEQNTTAGWLRMINSFQAEAKNTRLGIPLLYGVDAIHGHAHVSGATVFPHAIGLGATRNEALVESIARATAVEISATGANWSFSPNLDQPKDIRWGRVYEAFSDETALVSELGVAYVRGLQSTSSDDGVEPQQLILATPKHFLGLGGMVWNSSLNKNFNIDQGVTPAREEMLRNHYLPPFAEAIDAGALSVMVGLNTWGDARMVLQKYLLTDVLKGELRFKGFTVSDWYGVHEGRKNIFWATVSAVNAGVDMVMLPFDYKTFARHMKWANRLGLISDARIDDAVGRILYAKFTLGLFDKEAILTATPVIPYESHRVLAREAVAQSMVLVKNDEGVLPIQPNVSHIRVAGSAAHNIGKQMGAWSIEWQGIEGNEVLGATSILDGILRAVSVDTKVEFDRLGMFPRNGTKADIGIAVVGEKPYAEGWGDTAYPILDTEDLIAITHLQTTCKKVVVVIVSGRPLFIEKEIDSFDALVEAWLPGSEGEGVADVLFGRTPFSGRLPLPWPARSEQLPVGDDDTTADNTPLLFERGYGL
jgi:beta-glucosidase